MPAIFIIAKVIVLDGILHLLWSSSSDTVSSSSEKTAFRSSELM